MPLSDNCCVAAAPWFKLLKAFNSKNEATPSKLYIKALNYFFPQNNTTVLYVSYFNF